MPYVNIRITREGNTTSFQKAEMIRRVSDVLSDILGKDPETTHVVIDEVDLENWGLGGLPVEEYRARRSRSSQAPESPRPRR